MAVVLRYIFSMVLAAMDSVDCWLLPLFAIIDLHGECDKSRDGQYLRRANCGRGEPDQRQIEHPASSGRIWD
jgi:hypothetical protein